MLVYGINPVVEALRAGRVTAIRVGQRSGGRVQELLTLAAERGVKVHRVDSALLDPREAWADKAAYDRTAVALVQQFIDNFAQFADHVDEGVRQAAPRAAVAA